MKTFTLCPYCQHKLDDTIWINTFRCPRCDQIITKEEISILRDLHKPLSKTQ